MGLEAALGIASAAAGLLSGGAALVSAFRKPKSQGPPSVLPPAAPPVTPPTPSVLNEQDKGRLSPEDLAKRTYGALISTSPLGDTSEPTLNRSKLLGN